LIAKTSELYANGIGRAAQPEVAQALSRVTEGLNSKGAKK